MTKYSFGKRCPPWVRLWLRSKGFKERFDPEKLTADQRCALGFILHVMELVEKGLMEVVYTNDDVSFRATSRAERALSLLKEA